VISTIIKNTGSPAIPNTVDVIKEGDPQTWVIGCETQHWETYEYMCDAVDQGRNKAIIFLGHINSEESGMDYCSLWLKSFIKDIPVYFVESGPSFWSY
jgi:hypothetical protein